MLEVSKSMALLRVVVQRSGASVRGLDAKIVADEVSSDKVSVVTAAASVVEARLDRIVAAAVQGNLPAWLQRAAFGREVDDAGAAARTRRQAPGNELELINHPRRQGLPEHANAVRETPVQAKLQPVVVSPDIAAQRNPGRHPVPAA
jgi:hypothetical protein